MKIFKFVGYLFSTLVMYLGLPLLGWGLGDIRGFFSVCQRSGYALIVLILGLAVGWQALISPEGIRGSSGQDNKTIPRQRVIRIIITLLLFIALLYLPFADRRGIGVLAEYSAVRWTGVLFFSFGIALVFWSGFALGRLYSGDVTLQENHHLVTDGPYRCIRHPRYSGGILLGFGLSLIFNSWIGLLTSGIFIGIVFIRIKDEESLMLESFGQEWEGYCEHTWRLIPYIY
jgi:protein-S-isoprenylcysteine O-methyltransferase Ste14